MIGLGFLGSTPVFVPCSVRANCPNMGDAIQWTAEGVLVASPACQMEEVVVGVVLFPHATVNIDTRGRGRSTLSASAVSGLSSHIIGRATSKQGACLASPVPVLPYVPARGFPAGPNPLTMMEVTAPC